MRSGPSNQGLVLRIGTRRWLGLSPPVDAGAARSAADSRVASCRGIAISAAARLFAMAQPLFCRASLGLQGERPDTFKHILGQPLPTPFALYYYLA